MIDQGPMYEPDHIAFKRKCIGTQLKFTLIPQKCYITGKTLWLKNAYIQTAIWTGPGDAVFEYRWYDKDEFLIAKIKGNV